VQVAVIGAGALGCLFGGRLAADGHDVTLLHYRQDYVDVIIDRGLRIESDLDDTETVEVSVPATTDATAVGHVDLALVFVKAHQTETALEQHAACIGPETTVLSLQNGLGHYEALCDHVGEERALAGVTYQGAVIAEPGLLEHTSNGTSTFGGVDGKATACVAATLSDAGFPVETTGDPRVSIWRKQLISLPIKPLAALTRLPNGQLAADEELVDLMDRIVTEAEAVAAARGIDLSDEDFLNTVLHTCEESAGHRSSMLQDVLAGQKTEIGAVNGAIADIAREENVDVPANELVTRLVRGLEQSYLD
jgi:2-dehydropantoate 2-reductase